MGKHSDSFPGCISVKMGKLVPFRFVQRTEVIMNFESDVPLAVFIHRLVNDDFTDQAVQHFRIQLLNVSILLDEIAPFPVVRFLFFFTG